MACFWVSIRSRLSARVIVPDMRDRLMRTFDEPVPDTTVLRFNPACSSFLVGNR